MIGGIPAISVILGRVIGLIVGFTLHEYAHSRSAYELGDRQQYYSGRLTLDPRAHLEPAGIILAILVGFGWAKPVPVNTNAFYPNEQRGLMLTALAGPVTNLIIGFVVGFTMRALQVVGILGNSGFIYEVLFTIVFFNFILFLFNLIPLAPLDGWKILLGLLPAHQAGDLARYERESTFGLMMLLLLPLALPAVPSPLGVVFGPIIRLLMTVALGDAFI